MDESCSTYSIVRAYDVFQIQIDHHLATPQRPNLFLKDPVTFMQVTLTSGFKALSVSERLWESLTESKCICVIVKNNKQFRKFIKFDYFVVKKTFAVLAYFVL